MKTKRWYFLFILFSIFLLKSNTYLAQPTSPEKLKFQQLTAQIDYFQDALDEVGATTPNQVIELWVKGYETRNGVYQYAVSCDDLKEIIEEQLGAAEKNFWNIGGSSPWLSDYQVVEKRQLNKNEYRYKLKYTWSTSAPDDTYSYETLYLIKDGQYWCVQKHILSNR